jgi:uncharacterized protein
MSNFKISFDSTARRIDADGRLHVERSHISKAAVNDYYGQEIPGYQELGLQAEKVYKLLRDPVELEKGASTFARLPILGKHEKISVDDDKKELVIGSIGSNIIFENLFLDADLCFWDKNAIVSIESNQVKELSCAYRYDPVMESGEFDGIAYDGRMTNIRGNHLALVETGRAGSDVVVADESPFKKFEVVTMKMSKLGKALFAAICAASPVLAKDSALPALVGNAQKKGFDKKDLAAKLIALDATLNPQQLDNVIDALLDVEQEPKATELPQAAADESPEEKIRKMLAGKVEDDVISSICAMIAAPAADADPKEEEKKEMAKDKDKEEENMKKEDMKPAMDAAMAKLKTEFKDAAQAARDVREVVGDVAMDSAEEIYRFALDHLKVDHKGIEGVTALKALCKVASGKQTEAPVIAADSAKLDKRFEGVLRFGR